MFIGDQHAACDAQTTLGLYSHNATTTITLQYVVQVRRRFAHALNHGIASFKLAAVVPIGFCPQPKAKETELAQAAKNNELQTMEGLLAEGISADAKDEVGRPALWNAADEGHLDALKLLRRHGANLDATFCGNTALMCAACTGKADCAEALLEWGADKDAADNVGNTALHFAARDGHLECARLLVRANADRAKKSTTESFGVPPGSTALEVAREKGHAEVVTRWSRPM